MTERIIKPKRLAAFKWVYFQGVIALVLTLIGFFVWNAQYALSIACGGLVIVVSNIVFVFYAFRFAGARQSKLVVSSMFRGSMLRLVLSAGLTVLVISKLELVSSAYFLSFFIVLMTQWFLPVFFKQQKLG